MAAWGEGVDRRRRIEDELKSRPMPPEVALFLNVQRTAELMTTEFSQMLKPHGITQQQYNVLRILSGSAPDGLPCLEVASRMVTRVPDITRLVDRMVRDDLATRIRSEEDRRIVRIAITEKGADLVDRLRGPIDELHFRQAGRLDESEIKQLNALLEKFRTR